MRPFVNGNRYCLFIKLNKKSLGIEEKAAYSAISVFLSQEGFYEESYNLYIGKGRISSLHCINTIKELKNKFPWFRDISHNIMMIRISEITNLISLIN